MFGRSISRLYSSKCLKRPEDWKNRGVWQANLSSPHFRQIEVETLKLKYPIPEPIENTGFPSRNGRGAGYFTGQKCP